jgi:hypothetical protein
MSPELKNATSQDGRSKIPIYSKIAPKFNASPSYQINSAVSGLTTSLKQPIMKSAPHEPTDKENQTNLKATKSKLYK